MVAIVRSRLSFVRGPWPVVSCQLSVVAIQVPNTASQVPTPDCLFPTPPAPETLPFSDFWREAFRRKLLLGCMLRRFRGWEVLPFGKGLHWSFVIGHWSFVVRPNRRWHEVSGASWIK